MESSVVVYSTYSNEQFRHGWKLPIYYHPDVPTNAGQMNSSA
jgi:hypothetical protein